MELAKKEFAAQLPVKLNELSSLIQNAFDSNSSGSCEQARRIAHQLRGTVASYGFAEVGIYLSQVEDFLFDVQDESCTILPDEWSEALRILQKAQIAASALLSGNITTELSSRMPKILLIDSDIDTCEELNGVIKSQGLALHIEPDNIDIVNTLEVKQPDLLLAETFLPGLNGFELCRIVRSTSKWERLPIILMSNVINWEIRTAAYRAGADACMEKPIVAEELFACIARQLKRLT